MKAYTVLITFFVCYIPILIFSAIIPFLSRKTEIFGVSVPEAEYNNPEVKKIRGSYTASVLAFGIIMAFFALFTAFFGAADATMLFLPIGAFIQIAVMFVFYLVGHKSMKALKATNGWVVGDQQVVMVDTAFSNKKTMVSPLWFAVHIIIILSTLFLGFFLYGKMPDKLPMKYNFNGEVTRYATKSFKVLLFAPIIQTIITFLMAFIYWITGKSKQQINPSNLEQNRIFKYSWSAFIMFMGSLVLLIFAFMQLSFTGIIKDVRLIRIIPLTIAAIIIIAAIVLSIITGQGGSRIRTAVSKSGNSVRGDDDKYWKLGIFYYNPDDPALFVEKRFGIGWTSNFAKPMSWALILGIVIVLPLLMIFITKLLLK